MLLHIRPRFLAPNHRHKLELSELRVEPFGLCLTKKELASRKPYPNKNYTVACPRKGGNRAIDGLLIETEPGHIDKFSFTAIWIIDGSFESTHIVNYTIVDHDFDFASEQYELWYASPAYLRQRPDGTHEPIPAWSNRIPDDPGHPPEPFMEHTPHPEIPVVATTIDARDDLGRILIRTQPYRMPTLEPGRLTSHGTNSYLPDIASRFLV